MASTETIKSLPGVDLILAAHLNMNEFFKRRPTLINRFSVIAVQFDDPFIIVALQDKETLNVYTGVSKRNRHRRGDTFNLKNGMTIAIRRAFDLYTEQRPTLIP